MFFTMLLFELLPFCYVSFYSWDRKFFLADRVSGTYATSAYFTAHMLAGKLLLECCTLFCPSLYRQLPSCQMAFLCDFTLDNCLTCTKATSVYFKSHELAGNMWFCHSSCVGMSP